MQHWELPQDAHKTQTDNIGMTKHSHFPYTSTYSSSPHNTNIKHIIHHIHYTTYFNTPRQKSLFLTTTATHQTFPQSQHTVTITDIKQTCVIYIHILSLSIYPQETITKYCAHLHHTLAALKRYFPPHSSHHWPTQNKQISLPQIIQKVDAKSHPSALCPLYNNHIQDTHSSTAPTYAPHCHPWICVQNPLEPDGEISWLVDQKRNDRTPPHKQWSREWVDNNNITFMIIMIKQL